MVIDQKADSSITISPAALDEIHTIMKIMAGKAVSCFQKSLLPRSSVGGKQRNPCLPGPLDDDQWSVMIVIDTMRKLNMMLSKAEPIFLVSITVGAADASFSLCLGDDNIWVILSRPS